MMPSGERLMRLTREREEKQQQERVDKRTMMFILDGLTMTSTNANYWSHDLFSSVDNNSLFESIKLASSGEINWNEVDVKPYCGKRTCHILSFAF
jgi:hypothetical protein